MPPSFHINKVVSHYAGILSVGIVMTIFFLFNVVATPLLNSGDDTYMLYTLSGGYGEPPTNLLHYNHIWHLWLGGIVSKLFQLAPAINWYTIILLLFHLAGCSAILYVLLKKAKPLTAIFFFLLLFVFIEARHLLSLSFTGTAFVLATGAMSLLVYLLQQSTRLGGTVLFALVLLLLAGMLRLQIVWLVIALFASVVITVFNRQQIIRWGLLVAVLFVSLWGLNKLHEQYYTRHIDGWKEQEKFRQALFYGYNRQLVNNTGNSVFTDSAEAQLFFAGFLYDSVRFNTEKINKISRGITRSRSFTSKEDLKGLYWFFIELRVYIALFAVLIFVLMYQRRYRIIQKWFLSFLAFLAIHAYLFIYLKVTLPIHYGLLSFLLIALVLQFKKEQDFFTSIKKLSIPLIILFVLLFGWMGKRLVTENEDNKNKYQRFLCATTELGMNTDKLFIATDDAFPLNYFYIWNTPKEYPAANLLYKDRLITHTYLQTLKRFRITNLQEALLNNKKVFLLGTALPALEKSAEPAQLSPPFPVFRCMEVRQLNKKE
jgi:hypothetical protein